jgi:hypothetical protein
MLKLASTASLPAAAAVLLAACGSSSPKTGSQVAASAQNEGIKFASCMRTHGVPNFPDPTSAGGGIHIQRSQGSGSGGSGGSLSVNGVPVNAPAFQAAQTTCAKYMPKPPPLSATQVRNLSKAALEMASCMRTHGVPNFPDPKVQAGPKGGVAVQINAAGGGPNPSSPTFQAANKICMPIMAKAGIGGPRLAP